MKKYFLQTDSQSQVSSNATVEDKICIYEVTTQNSFHFYQNRAVSTIYAVFVISLKSFCVGLHFVGWLDAKVLFNSLFNLSHALLSLASIL